MFNDLNADTIVAIATPVGRGGVGIIRVSGPKARAISKSITGTNLRARYAHYLPFVDSKAQVLDQGLALLFPAPNSFTGEDVLELQGHGGPIILNMIVEAVCDLGARLANPGEFSARAFLNNKIDLIQAESIADLIDASSKQAAQLALSSLQGKFSDLINQYNVKLIHLRMFIEACLDFPDDALDLPQETEVQDKVLALLQDLDLILQQAKQGQVQREGLKVIILGQPNAGKSSLLNQLAGEELAMVTNIPGTTRDLIRSCINLQGVDIHLVDTAGIRETQDVLEQMGIERASQALKQVQHVIWVVDASVEGPLIWPHDLLNWQRELENLPGTVFLNKIDQVETPKEKKFALDWPVKFGSAKTGQGIEEFKSHLANVLGITALPEGAFIARKRHTIALEAARSELKQGLATFKRAKAYELLAQNLLQAQSILESITGRFSSDDLLGKIFSEFCIGK